MKTIKTVKAPFIGQSLVQDFWNYHSRFPDKYFNNLHGKQISKLNSIYTQRGEILDYACGTGALIGHLLSADFFVASCDLSPDSIEYVKKILLFGCEFSWSFEIDDITRSKKSLMLLFLLS